MFAYQDSDLVQVGDHHPNRRLIRHRWIPFAVVSGILHPETALNLKERISGHYKYPLTLSQNDKISITYLHSEEPWSFPEDMKEKILGLCHQLHTNELVQQEMSYLTEQAEAISSQNEEHSNNTTNRGGLLGRIAGLLSKKGGDIEPKTENGETKPLPHIGYTINWENMDFSLAPMQFGDKPTNRMWPHFVKNTKILLIKNRIPILDDMTDELISTPDYSARKRLNPLITPRRTHMPTPYWMGAQKPTRLA